MKELTIILLVFIQYCHSVPLHNFCDLKQLYYAKVECSNPLAITNLRRSKRSSLFYNGKEYEIQVNG